MNPSVGQPINRVDGRAKVTGAARYSADWPVDGLLHAVIFNSTIASGQIRGFDLRSARSVPGVVEILTFENAPKLKMPESEKAASTGESFIPLQDPRVYYNGQAIGAVIASSLEAAEQAAQRVRVQYSPHKAQLGLTDLELGSYVLEEMKGMGPINFREGNTSKGLKQSQSIVKADYSTPIENHNPMEPSATLVSPENGGYKIYESTQGVYAVAELMSEALATDIEKVHVITKFIGGGFGCKGSVWPHQFIAVMCAKKTGRPVKLVMTRQQMFTGVGHRAHTVQKVTLGAHKDGRLQAIRHVVYNNTAVNKDYSERSGAPTQTLYSSESFDVVHRLKKVNLQAPTFMRAPGESSGSFALESAMDELAHQLGMDPIQLRLANYAETDPKEKKPYSSKSLRACYDQGARQFGWGRRSAAPGQKRDGDWLIGYGMASSTYPSMTFPATARVELLSDGTAKVISATQDIGTGTYTVLQQIAADGLGLDFDSVRFDLGDSRYPRAGVSGGSTTLASVGSAIRVACDKMKAKLAGLAVDDPASPLHGLSIADIGFTDGRLVSTQDPSRAETYAKLLARQAVPVISVTGSTPEEDENYASHAFGAQFAEVRVHRLTGETRLQKVTGAFAAGKIINPKTARNQFMGGIIFGIGMALMEETAVDLRSGRLVTKDLADYHVPVQADVPEMDILMIDETDPHVNAVGAKGIGEIGIVGTAAAIANAVYNATGVRVRNLPITPDKLIGQMARVRA